MTYGELIAERNLAGVRRRAKWDKRFIDEAYAKAKWSKDRSTKTGCVIVQDNRILCTGYNGFPPGVDDDVEARHDRPAKYRFTEHAERNAIYQAANFGIPLKGSTLYVTGTSCDACMRGIIMAGIVRVVWPEKNPFSPESPRFRDWVEAVEAAKEMADEAGVSLCTVKE